MTAPEQAEPFRRVTIIQGEHRVSDDKQLVLTTVLGSCISACLYDPLIGVGGMNHFLLAEPGRATHRSAGRCSATASMRWNC